MLSLESIVRAGYWKDLGLPAVAPVDRLVYGALCFDGPVSIQVVSRAVWGSPHHRKAARASLDRLAGLGIARLDTVSGLWAAVLPFEKREG